MQFPPPLPSLLYIVRLVQKMAVTLPIVVVVGLFTVQAFGVNNGLARTPQMGWAS